MVKKARKENPWLKHLKDYKDKHPKMKYGDCMAAAKKTYTKK